jgi:hypothetical protein
MQVSRFQSRPKPLDFSGVVKILKHAFGGEAKYVSHVPALRHVKEPSNSVSYELLAKFPPWSWFHPSLTEVSHAAWCGAPLEMNDGTH